MSLHDSLEQPRAVRDYLFLGLAAGLASVAFFVWYYHRDAILLYGDAVAHINITRRVFDSRTPGFQQLGTVWLPLPHLLMMPFLVSDWMWRTGAGGAIVSMISYVGGTLGIYRLVGGATSRPAAWLAAIVYAANPNLLYLQTTAMTEPLFLALMVWAAVYLSEFAQFVRRTDSVGQGAAARSLMRCGWFLALGMLTRYDAWFLGVVAAGVVALYLDVFGFTPRRNFTFGKDPGRLLRQTARRFVMVIALVPVLWLSYNYYVYGNPLEFATGPDSPQGIALRTTPPDAPPHPGAASPLVGGLYFLKAARLNMGEGAWQYALFLPALLGLFAAMVLRGATASWLVLWLPVWFYPLVMAYGSVPIFLPVWWPFSYYNVRYGLEVLPAFAAFSGLALFFVRQQMWRGQTAVVAVAIVLVGAGYASCWIHDPITLREAKVNSVTRVAMEEQVAVALRRLPASSTLLMQLSHPGILQDAGIPIARVIHEGNFGDWEMAISQPAVWADYVVAFGEDAVARSVGRHQNLLQPIAVIEVEGQPRVVIYKSQVSGTSTVSV